MTDLLDFVPKRYVKAVDDVLQDFIQSMSLERKREVQSRQRGRTSSTQPMCKLPLAYGGPSCNTKRGPFAFSHYFMTCQHIPRNRDRRSKGYDLPTVEIITRLPPECAFVFLGISPEREVCSGQEQRVGIVLLLGGSCGVRGQSWT